MLKDPIMEELHRVKDQLAAEFGYDVRRMAKALQAEQKRSGRKVVSFTPRTRKAKAKS